MKREKRKEKKKIQPLALRTEDSGLSTEDSALSTSSSGLSTRHSALRTQHSALRTQHSALDLFCPQCGYNLRGIDSDRCPECGYSLDFLKLTEAQLPWLRRAEIGRVRAYWRTVLTAILHKKKFWEEISRPASYRDAQLFRWITILVAYLPLIPITIAVLLSNPDQVFSWALENEAFVFIGTVIVIHMCILLFLAGATGLPSYFFHPKSIPVEHQNRAVALSYYCCAPLAWLPLACAVPFCLYLLIRYETLEGNSLIAAVVLMACVFLSIYFFCRLFVEWLLELNGLHKRATQSETVRYGLFLVLLPFLWFVLGCLILVGLPLVFGYVALVITSLW